MEPFPTSDLTVIIKIFATTTKICTRGGSTQTHDPGSVTTPHACLLLTHVLRFGERLFEPHWVMPQVESMVHTWGRVACFLHVARVDSRLLARVFIELAFDSLQRQQVCQKKTRKKNKKTKQPTYWTPRRSSARCPSIRSRVSSSWDFTCSCFSSTCIEWSWLWWATSRNSPLKASAFDSNCSMLFFKVKIPSLLSVIHGATAAELIDHQHLSFQPGYHSYITSGA